MYSLDINFLNDRPEYRSDAGSSPKPKPTLSGSTPMVLGIVIGVALPALAGGAWFYLQNQNTSLQSQQRELEAQIGSLQAKLKDAEAFNTQAAQIEAEADGLAAVFNQVKPWSAMLQDISERVPPGVQIDSVQESGGTITLAGTARSYNDVNDFLLVLQKSPFLKSTETQLLGAQLTNYANQVEYRGLTPNQTPVFALPQVVSYRIATRLSDLPATELLRELDRKGAVGLVTRIRTLQEKGIIK